MDFFEKKSKKKCLSVLQTIAEVILMAIVVNLLLGKGSHPLTKLPGRLHTKMIGVERQLLNQLVVHHHVKRHPTTSVA